MRAGRPALLVKDRLIAFDGALPDATSQAMIDRLKRAAPIVERVMPLVGRIDVANHRFR